MNTESKKRCACVCDRVVKERTCCFSGPATVGAASAVPHHQLPALHHGLERLPADGIGCKM